METPQSKRLDKTIKSFSYNVLGTISPLLLSLLPIILLRKYEAIGQFVDEGQVLIFGAGLFTISIYLYGENKDSVKKRYDKILSTAALWLLIVCSAFYAIIYCLILLKQDFFCLNKVFIRCLSIILFVISVLSVYRSIYIDFEKTIPNIDVKSESNKEVNSIMNKL